MKIFVGVFTLMAVSGIMAFAADRAAYDKSCKTCHGPDGQGNAAIAKVMKVELKPLGSPAIQSKSDADLKAIVTKGSGKMKAVAGLSAKEVDEAIAFVRTLKK